MILIVSCWILDIFHCGATGIGHVHVAQQWLVRISTNMHTHSRKGNWLRLNGALWTWSSSSTASLAAHINPVYHDHWLGLSMPIWHSALLMFCWILEYHGKHKLLPDPPEPEPAIIDDEHCTLFHDNHWTSCQLQHSDKHIVYTFFKNIL